MLGLQQRASTRRARDPSAFLLEQMPTAGRAVEVEEADT